MLIVRILVLAMILNRFIGIRGLPNQIFSGSFAKRLKSNGKPRVVSNQAETVTVSCSSHEMQGYRPYMEDRLIIGFDNRLAAVCDGHGGAGVAEALHKHYLTTLTSNYISDENLESLSNHEVSEGIKKAMNDVDNIVLPDRELHRVGSTFALSFIHSNPKPSIISVNVGDSRIVLSQGGKAIDLTVDHKPSVKSEKIRIERLGGTVVKRHNDCDRVAGVLSLSRAIGDRYLKPFVSSDADVRVHSVTSKDEFVIVATDGIWEDFTSQQAVDYIHHISERIELSMKDPATMKSIMDNFPDVTDTEWVKRKLAAELLCHAAIKKGSTDNVSVVIQWLKVASQE